MSTDLLPDARTATATELTAAMVDVASVSGAEAGLCDAVERQLRAAAHLDVTRAGNAVLARTNRGRGRRVLLAGHLDTVPIAANVPHRRVLRGGEDAIRGRGSVDMKGGCAIQMALAVTLTEPRFDVTWVFYDNEEVDTELSGLKRLIDRHPEKIGDAEFAVVTEPTAAQVEAGCNSTMRVRAEISGRAAHSARSWLGDNAVHAAAPILARLADYRAQTVLVDSLAYRESLSAVAIDGYVAYNTIPDECRVWINYRFAPSKTERDAVQHIRDVLSGLDVALHVENVALGALPGLGAPAARDFLAAAKEQGARVGPKCGWTDVARLAAAGVPGVNFGPGDPVLAHTDDEHCPVAQIEACHAALTRWLSQPA